MLLTFTLGQRNAFLVAQTQEHNLGSTSAAASPAAGACSTAFLRPNNKEHDDLLLVISSSRSDAGSLGRGLGGPVPVLPPIPSGTTRNSGMKSIAVGKEAKHNPASA